MAPSDRWVGRMDGEPAGRTQIDDRLRRASSVLLPEHVLRLAQAEYEHQQGRQQDYERMQERGGLSVFEVVGLLADYVERLGGVPTKPRQQQAGVR